MDRRRWLGPRGRLATAGRVAVGIVVVAVGLWVGTTRNPFGYALALVGVFLVILAVRVGVRDRRDG